MRSRRGSVKLNFLRRFSKLADLAYEMGDGGERWGAMVLNGMIYSSLLGYDVSPAMKALRVGALGSGLSGTGPAVSAVFERGAGEDHDAGTIELLRKNWARDGSKVIVTESNNEHGEMVRLDR